MSEIKEMDMRVVRGYYLRPDVLDMLFDMCDGREIVPVYYSRKFGKRPASVMFRGDIEHMVRDGATSFHCSLEHWSNPLLLSNSMKKIDMHNLRTGWDIFLDIDANDDFEHARITTRLLAGALSYHGVTHYSIKFSGRRGFHIAVPFKSMPSIVTFMAIETLYPTLLHTIADYLRAYIRDDLVKELVSYDSSLESRIGKNPFQIVEVEHNWSYRHLFRMPYSFNEKSGLVSVPITLSQLDTFRPEDAHPDKVRPELKFLGGECPENESADLVMCALDYDDSALKRLRGNSTASGIPKGVSDVKVSVECFPPCITTILKGVHEGRKRSIFILMAFLNMVGWDWQSIEALLLEWNTRNPEPIEDSYLKGQLNYSKKSAEPKLPPNCANEGYYKDIGVCKPDEFCSHFKNPVNYAIQKAKGKDN